MSLQQQIDSDLKDAMRAKDAGKLGVLRMLKSALKYAAIEKSSESALDDAAASQVIRKQVKQRQDSIESFEKGGRPELFLNVFHPERDDLFVAGLIQPDSGQFGLVDRQAQLIAAYLLGLKQNQRGATRLKAAKQKPGRLSPRGVRYVDSPRHLLEVEHFSYRRALESWTRSLR